MSLQKTIYSFDPISLEEAGSVKMMNRTDTKYVLQAATLHSILEEVKNEYLVLEINGKRILPYETLYFDTSENSMYLAHHNGKLNRYKIRFRKYITSNDTFLEIKQKVKGVRTIKKRIVVQEIKHSLDENSRTFISSSCPFNPDLLESKIYTNFSRITLVSKLFNERATIDTNLEFHFKDNNRAKLNNSIIIELKRDSQARSSKLSNILSKYGIRPEGMSKYCIGRAITETGIKKNNFKPKIISINKIEKT